MCYGGFHGFYSVQGKRTHACTVEHLPWRNRSPFSVLEVYRTSGSIRWVIISKFTKYNVHVHLSPLAIPYRYNQMTLLDLPYIPNSIVMMWLLTKQQNVQQQNSFHLRLNTPILIRITSNKQLSENEMQIAWKAMIKSLNNIKSGQSAAVYICRNTTNHHCTSMDSAPTPLLSPPCITCLTCCCFFSLLAMSDTKSSFTSDSHSASGMP